MITIIFQAISVFLTIFSIGLAIKWYKVAKHYEPMAKRLASLLGKKGSKARWDKRDKQRVESIKNKAIKNLIESIPMAKEVLKKTKISEEEAFLLMTDEDIAPKIMRIIQITQKTLGKVDETISGFFEEKQKTEKF